MNPNSTHQLWSKWTITVMPPGIVHRTRRTRADVALNAARFFRKAFGAATQCRIDHAGRGPWVFEVRSEGHPVHDPAYVAYLDAAFTRFFTEGFGPGTAVRTDTKLEAGSRQDGTPADQLLMLPTITFDPLEITHGECALSPVQAGPAQQGTQPGHGQHHRDADRRRG